MENWVGHTAQELTRIAYGTGFLEARLPERTKILKPPPSLPALPDVAEAVKQALDSPLNHEPLSKLVGPKLKVAIAFDDPCMPILPPKQPDFRETTIKILLRELERLGVPRHNIQLICANALHRKWTQRELATILGEELVLSFGPHRLRCHDAEDKDDIVCVGETPRGMLVEVSKAVTESDQLIYVNVNSQHFNGGWKSIAVGLSSYNSIRQHHRPFPRASGKSVMDYRRSSFQKIIWEMGDVVAAELAKKGRRIFTIESVPTNRIPAETAAVFAGNIPDVHEKTIEMLQRQLVIEVRGQVDVAIFGLSPHMDPYSKLSFMNPILVRNTALSYAFGLYQGKPLIREGGIAIFIHPCPRAFDDIRFPSYIAMYEEILPRTQDPFEIWDVYSEDYAHRPEFIHHYRYRYSYHGAHPLILWGQGAYALRHLGKVFLAGAQDPDAARLMGFEPFPTVAEAIAEAERLLGKDCSIAYASMPPAFIISVE
ncbi:MAG TPA: DUF2088 domain-containing protein [Dehalococcoidia bacterium]|nr:DUF2088 domain-containing protein [Dehalococcoidia bacterium]